MNKDARALLTPLGHCNELAEQREPLWIDLHHIALADAAPHAMADLAVVLVK